MKKFSLPAVFAVMIIFVAGLSVPALASPGIVIVPMEHHFGEVEVGSSSTTIITIANNGSELYYIDNVGLASGGSADFSILSAPASGTVLLSGESAEVEVTYTPSAVGYVSATLAIDWTNGDSGVSLVELDGTGVEAPGGPVTIDSILAFFDQSVEDGTLEGRSRFPRIAEWRLNRFRNMIVVAGVFIDNGWMELACWQLERIDKRCDGERWPRDLVEGEAGAELNAMILQFMADMGCE